MGQKARWTLPNVVNPPDSLCVQINVPNDEFHIAAFMGAIFALSKPYNWQNDAGHTALQAGAVWADIFNALQLVSCDSLICPTNIEDYEDEMALCDLIRFQNGKLQVLCCNVWTDVPGQASQGIGGASQPGAGIPIPANGACQTYHASFDGSNQWLLPPAVNAGDTIVISNIQGAWTDGASSWYTPDGWIFFAGIKGGVSPTNGADPLNTKPHMGLLVKVNGVFYYVGDGSTLTIPGGVSNKLAIFQANDASLSDDYGNISFDVTYCNNQAVTWGRKFDYRVAQWGSARGASFTPPGGTWTPGTGWGTDDGSSGGNSYRTVDVNQPLGATCEITSVQTLFNYVQGAESGVDTFAQWLYDGAVLVQNDSAHAVAGSGVNINWNGDHPGVTAVQFSLRPSDVAGGTGGLTGSATYLQLIVRGVGTPPANGVAI